MSTTTTQTMTNGEMTSKLLEHLTSYPIVHDTISTYKSYPLGQKSIDITQTSYDKFIAPFVPYAKGPYGYVAPYVSKADMLASDSLTKVDEKFPIVKEDTEKLKSSVLDLAFLPFRIANDSKNYVFDTYGSEYKKCGGDGYVSSGKAMITTSMVVTSDSLAWISNFLSAKREEGRDFAKEKYRQGTEYAEKGKGFVTERRDAAYGFASEKAEMAKEYAGGKAEEAKKGYEDAKGSAKETANQ